LGRGGGYADPMVKHIYAISHALADGIAKQFPEKVQ
jgi:hypothetical protein